MVLTQATPAQFAEILALNESSVHFLSPLSPQRLAQLHEQSSYHKVVLEGDRVVAFLLAFAPGSSYDSINYQWFEARLTRFFYIDRVVVSSDFRGMGLASLVYRDLFDHARDQGMSQVVCEFDIDPPNPASEAFHRRFGFSQLGIQAVADGNKWVSLQCAPLMPAACR